MRVVLQCSTQTQPAGKAASQALMAPQWNKRTEKEGEMGRSNMHVWVDRETGEKPMLREGEREGMRKTEREEGTGVRDWRKSCWQVTRTQRC